MNEDLQGLNLIELLDLLEPTPEPPPISMMPQTPGWIVVGLILAAGTALALRAWWRHRRANAYRRHALRELSTIPDEATAVATLLRRVALAGFPREKVASLSGQDWLTFLDRTGKTTGFSQGPGQVMLTAPYKGGSVSASPDLVRLARKWIRDHRQDIG